MLWNGELVLENHYVLSGETRLSDFMQSPLYSNQKTHKQFWLDRPYEIEGHLFAIGVYFTEALLSNITLYCRDKQFEGGNTSWETLDLAEELKAQEQRKRFHDEFIKQHLQTDTSKKHPSVSASVDSRNVNLAQISIAYR